MVKPSVQQTLETKPQESSEFLKRINVVGVAGTLASTTDTTQKYPEPQAIRTLDQWAKFPDFQKRIAKIKEKHIALDRIMLGFNGTSRATTSNRTTNPPLQDVAKGWLEKIHTDAPKHRFAELPDTLGKINGGKGQTYQNLDALVYSALNDLIDPIYQDDPELVAIIGRNLLADEYFPLINANTDKATEQLVADLVIGQNASAVYPRCVCRAYWQARF